MRKNSPAHLNVFAGGDVPEVHSIKLPRSRKNNGLCGHVDSHCKCLCCEQALEQALAEQYFYNLFQQWEEAAVMNSNASLQ